MKFLNHLIALTAAVFLFATTGACAEWLEWGRFRLHPELSLKEAHSDNVFKSAFDKQPEFITTVSPELSFDVAVAPHNYFSIYYVGDFEFHSKYDNFKTVHNLGELSWNWLTSAGSQFKAGGSVKDTANQPYSETGRPKDYLLYRAFAHADLAVAAFTTFSLKYDFKSRQYNEIIDEIDDFDRHTATASVIYDYFSWLPLLLEYRFTDQKNRSFHLFSRDFKTSSALVGAMWQGRPHLNGALRLGYFWSNTDSPRVGDYTGLAIDADLTYRYSDITSFALTAFRHMNTTTLAERQTGNYYVATGSTFSVKYHYWERIILSANLRYSHDDYLDTPRLDNYYRAGVRIKYLVRDWVSISLRYRYRRRDSNLPAVDYNENRVQAVFTLSL